MKAYSVVLNNINACCDRFMPGGYEDKRSVPELFRRLSDMDAIKGVELVVGDLLSEDNVNTIKDCLEKYRFDVISVIPAITGSPVWGKGAFTSPDRQTRKAAVEETCHAMLLARELGCGLVNVWNGQDGYDYPFQADYAAIHEYLVDGLRECADRFPDMKLSVEYKQKEPRNHSFVSNVHSTLLLLDEIGRKNVGMTIDTGHALLAYENMAEAVVTALKRNKLFHLHLNDNYRLWDDDMITGSVHTIEFIEMFYWLKRLGYEGWLSLDQYPYREDGTAAAFESIRWLEAFRRAADAIDKSRIEEVFATQDAVRANALVRELMFRQ